MRKLIGVILCLWMAAHLSAVTYEPCKASDFRSTSSYVTGGNQMPASPTQWGMAVPRTAPTGSLSAISASNFQSLNSEEGLLGASSAPSGPRRGRPGGGEGGGAIGDYDYHSPVGDAPWRIMLLLGVGYIAFLTFRRQTRNP